MYSYKKFIAEWETPVWQHLKNIHSVQQWGFHMLQGFHTFKPHQLSAACQYVSHLLLDNMLSRGGGGAGLHCFMSLRCEDPPPPGTRAASLCLPRPPEVPGQQLQGTAAGWLASALMTASSWGVTETIPLSGGSPFTQITKHLSVLLWGGGEAEDKPPAAAAAAHICANTENMHQHKLSEVWVT